MFNEVNSSLSRQIKARVENLMLEHSHVPAFAELSAQDQRRLDISSPDVVD